MLTRLKTNTEHWHNGRHCLKPECASPLLPFIGKSLEELEEDEPRCGDHTKAERPRCEHKGSLPHPATHVLVWDLSSGRQTKFMCDRHSKDASPQPYFVAELISYNKREKTNTDE
jgi:hypothetical protein